MTFLIWFNLEMSYVIVYKKKYIHYTYYILHHLQWL